MNRSAFATALAIAGTIAVSALLGAGVAWRWSGAPERFSAWHPAPEAPAHLAMKMAAAAPVVGSRNGASVGVDAYGRAITVIEYTSSCPTAGESDPCAVYAVGDPGDPAISRITFSANDKCMLGAASFADRCDAQAIDTANAMTPEGFGAGP